MLLELQNIVKSFGSPEEPGYREVLRGLSLKVRRGELIAILGPSGSGKTTLLNIAGTLDTPDSGEVLFNGESMRGASHLSLDQFRNREIGFVFQFHHLLPQCSLIENILIPTIPQKQKGRNGMAYAEKLMKQVGIWVYRHKLPGKLSGGECQRAAIVRAMINQPSLLLADEPTGALDGKNVDNLADLLIQMNKEEGLAVIMVTHSEQLASRMQRVYRIEEGVLEEHQSL